MVCLSCNSLPSIWYGITVVALQTHVLYRGIKQFFEFTNSSSNNEISLWELNLYVTLQGIALVLLSVVGFASFFKTGNLANDSYRLGRSLDLEMDFGIPSSKTRDPLIRHGSVFGAAWRHSPPVGPLGHAIAALCTLVSKLVLEARLIKSQILSNDHIWGTDLDDFINIMNPFTQKTRNSTSNIYMEGVPLPSLEYISYAVSLLALAVSAANVYWGVNKCLAIFMSVQLVANGITALLVLCGASILYKLEICVESAANTFSELQIIPPLTNYFLLDPPITIMLLLLLSVTLLLGSSPLTMYALNKLSVFLISTRKDVVYKLPSSRSYLWRFYPHLAGLATLLAIAACSVPLLHDFSQLYKLKQHPALLVAGTGSIVHAFLWLALWMLLTAKTHWSFRLKVSVGRGLITSPSSLAVFAEVECTSGYRSKSQESSELLFDKMLFPSLVIAGGKAYCVSDYAAQRKIQEIISHNHSRESGEFDPSETIQHKAYIENSQERVLPSPKDHCLSSSSLQEPLMSAGSSSTPTVNRHKINFPHALGSPSPATTILPINELNRPAVSLAATNVLNKKSVMFSPILTRPIHQASPVRLPTSDGNYSPLRDLPLIALPRHDSEIQQTTSYSESIGVDLSVRPVLKQQDVQPFHRYTTAWNRDICNPYGYVKPKVTSFTTSSTNSSMTTGSNDG